MYDDRITKKAVRGQHIKLTCKNHPELEWSTKNISHIGARNIFFSSNWDNNPIIWKIECSCTARDLIVHPDYETMPDVPE